jgi:hypothetical protein
VTPIDRDASEREHFAWQQRQKELAELNEHWGEAYDIGWSPGSTGGWHAGRRDDGTVLRRRAAEDLHKAIRRDYDKRPVPRRDYGAAEAAQLVTETDDKPDDYGTASYLDPDDLQRDGIDPR